MTLELTEQEANALVGLINEAVKMKGLEVAQTALYFCNKVKDASLKKEEPTNGKTE